MIHYKINKTNITTDGQRHTTYGIDVYDADNLLNSVFDISPNKSFVQELIYKCNVNHAAPEHLMDIVYDSIE